MSCKVVSFVCVLALYGAQAETYYWNGSGGRDAGKTPSYWLTQSDDPAESFDSQSTYVVASDRTLLTTSSGSGAAASMTFEGGKLVFGEIGGTTGSFTHTCNNNAIVTFQNDGAFFANGTYTYNGSANQARVQGKITVTAPNSAPFMFRTMNFANQNWRFQCAMEGAQDTGIDIKPGTSNLTLRLEGDCSKLRSDITVSGDTSNGYKPMTLEVGAAAPVHFGRFVVNGAATVRTSTATNHVVADSLSLTDGSRLKIASAFVTGTSDRTNSMFVALNSFSASGTVTVEFDDSAVKDDGVTNRIVVLQVPIESEIDLSVFKAEYTGVYQRYLLPFAVERDEIAGVKRIVTGIAPFVTFVSSDNQDKARNATLSSFTNATSWSDGLIPHAGAHYLVAKNSKAAAEWTTEVKMTYLRSPNDESEATRKFEGESLTIGTDCRLLLFCKVFDLKKLVLEGGSQLWLGQMCNTIISNAQIVVEAGTVDLAPWNNKSLFFDSSCRLSGSGTLKLGQVNLTSSVGGDYAFKSDNSDFFGRIFVTQYVAPSDSVTQRQTVIVSSENGLGGDLQSFDPYALEIERQGIVYFNSTTDVVLRAESNRGIYIGDSGCMRVAPNITATCYRTLTVAEDGQLRKDGNGTLALGGELLFDLPDGAENVTNATVNIDAGKLAVLSADSVDGLKLSFASGTELVLKADSTNADLMRYGIRNVKTDTPFSLAGGQETLPLTVDWSSFSVGKDEVVTQALVTVSSAAAAGVRSIMPSFRRPVEGARARSVEIEEGGNTTFALVFDHPGIMMIVY